MIAAASQAGLWYLDQKGNIGPLDGAKIGRHRKDDPNTFLARLAIIAEGATEVGFTVALLERALGAPLEQYGVHVSDGTGHENTLALLEALAEGGLRFGGFADNEGKHPGRWQKLSERLGGLLFRWASLCLEENVISLVPDDLLESLMIDPEGEKTGMRRHTLAVRLEIEAKTFAEVKEKATGLKRLIIEAALGTVPKGKEDERNQYRSHGTIWFKSVPGGRELADKVFTLGLWPALKTQLLPFCNAVRVAVGLPEAPDFST